MKDAYRSLKQLEAELNPMLDKWSKDDKGNDVKFEGLLTFLAVNKHITFLMGDVNKYLKSQGVNPLYVRDVKQKWEDNLIALRNRYEDLQKAATDIENMNIFQYLERDKAEKALEKNIKEFRSDVTSIMMEVANFNENLASAILGLSETLDPVLSKTTKDINFFYFKLNNTPCLEPYTQLNTDSKVLNVVKQLREESGSSFIPKESLEKIKNEFRKIPLQYVQQLRKASNVEEIDQIMEDYTMKTQINSNNLRSPILLVGKALAALDKAKVILETRTKEYDPSVIREIAKINPSQPEESKGRRENLTPEQLAEIRSKFRPELPPLKETSSNTRSNKP